MSKERIEQYLAFREQAVKKESMDKRNFVVVLKGFPEIVQSKLLLDVSETLHLPHLAASTFKGQFSFEDYLKAMPPHGFVTGDLPGSQDEQIALLKWSLRQGMSLHFCHSEQVFIEIMGENVYSHRLNGDNITRKFFQELSPFCFEDPKLAEKYFQFLDICKEKKIPNILVAGACSYIYWGRRPLKDLDILVPSKKDLEAVASEVDGKIEHLISAYADTNYLNFSEGVEVISDLKVLYEDEQKRKIVVPFDFKELESDAQNVRFMGESSWLMSPEMLVLFKFSLGRFGVDQWGHHKDDYEDASGVLVSQNIDLDALRKRAEKLSALPRVALGEKILNLSV